MHLVESADGAKEVSLLFPAEAAAELEIGCK